MDLGIRGRVALITGASAGLGKACAQSLAAEGASVALAARRRDKLEEAAAQALAAGASDAQAFSVDLRDPASMESLLHDVRERFGAPEIVIANGGGPHPGGFMEQSLEDWDTGYRDVLRAMLQLVRGVVPAMRERAWGRIVALTSTSVKAPIATLALSNVFRTGLISALKTLSLEVAADGITVNAIATGRIRTDRLRSLYGSEEALQRAGEDVPIKRIAEPDEFAPLVTFLCSEPARYVTGQTIAIDGGLVAGLFG